MDIFENWPNTFSGFCIPEESLVVCARAWIAAIGPLVAVVALFVAMRQFSLSRDTTRRQLRAYMGVMDAGFELVNLIEGGQGIRVRVRLRNSGNSPAYNFTTWIAPPVVANATDEPFGPPLPLSQRISGSIVFADCDTWLQSTMAITAAQLAAIRQGTSKIFVWGGADYRDAFGKRRTLKFYDINGQEEHPGVWALQPHRKGYHAD